jgi:RNA polymerase sigma-70 factor (family 1)
MTARSKPLWTDGSLLSQLRQGDQAAFTQLYTTYWERLYRTAFALLREPATSQDVVQQVMVDLWERRQSLQIDSLGAFLHTAVRYQVLKLIRDDKLHQQIYERIQQLSLPDQSGHNPVEAQALADELSQTVEVTVSQLPPVCRQIYLLSRVEQLSNRDIAQRLAISPKTVENQLTIALRRLRNALTDYLPTLLMVLEDPMQKKSPFCSRAFGGNPLRMIHTPTNR